MRSWQLFEAGIAPFDKNDIPADSWDYAGESAKNRFLIYQPIAEKFAYLCTKIDEISWGFFILQCKSIFCQMAYRHQKLQKVKITLLSGFTMAKQTNLIKKSKNNWQVKEQQQLKALKIPYQWSIIPNNGIEIWPFKNEFWHFWKESWPFMN